MFFKEKKPDIEFVDKTHLVYLKLPVQRSQDVKPNYIKQQKDKHGQFTFSLCPGMFDLYKAGYIIPAWCDIHIKANKAGVTTILGGHRGEGKTPFESPRSMDASLIDGILTPEDDVPSSIVHIGSPWSIFTEKNISTWVGPAVYHSAFLDDLHVWPGIVDYNKNFHTINFIFSPKRECEVHIKAGEPLLQVMPFLKCDVTAKYGPVSDIQLDSTKNQIVSQSEFQYYRKNISVPKIFDLLKR